MKKFKSMFPFIGVILFIIGVISICIYIVIKNTELDVSSNTLEENDNTIIVEDNVDEKIDDTQDDSEYAEEIIIEDNEDTEDNNSSNSSSQSTPSSKSSSSDNSSSNSTSNINYPITKYVNTPLNTPKLKIHSGPSLSYDAVGYVYRGDEVIVYEVKSGFSRIGDNMWVSSNYLSDTPIDVTEGATIDSSTSSSSSENNANTSNSSSTENNTNSSSNSSSESTNSSTSNSTPTFVETKTETNVTNTTLSYGVIKVLTTTTTYDLYSDGSKKNEYTTYKYSYDYSGYNETTSSLKADAISNKSTYASQVQEVLNNTNALRAEVASDALNLDDDLTTAAMIRAIEIAYSGEFSHIRPDGTRCFTVLSDLGIKYSTIGENIAMGSSSASYTVNTIWKNSEEHYKNMIRTNFTKIGIGVVKGPNGIYYWVQIFSA